MNGERYQEVLFWMDNFGAYHFLHNRAPCYASRRIQEFPERLAIMVIDWPGNSPDFPIENM
jgi:hypothetical protein